MKSDEFKKLVVLLTSIDSVEEMENLLTGLLTPKEREELPTRIEIIKMLKKGIPQHQIAENLGVGIATVTRGSKEIQQGTFKVIK
jgi:TrpR family trp operon transcriptional repressor